MSWGWLIPLLVVLFAVGKLMEAWRLAQGSVYEDMAFLRAAIDDVRKFAKALEPQSEDDAEQKLALAKISAKVNEMLAMAESELKDVTSQLELPTPSGHKALRQRLRSAMRVTALARSEIERHAPPNRQRDSD